MNNQCLLFSGMAQLCSLGSLFTTVQLTSIKKSLSFVIWLGGEELFISSVMVKVAGSLNRGWQWICDRVLRDTI